MEFRKPDDEELFLIKVLDKPTTMSQLLSQLAAQAVCALMLTDVTALGPNSDMHSLLQHLSKFSEKTLLILVGVEWLDLDQCRDCLPSQLMPPNLPAGTKLIVSHGKIRETEKFNSLCLNLLVPDLDAGHLFKFFSRLCFTMNKNISLCILDKMQEKLARQKDNCSLWDTYEKYLKELENRGNSGLENKADIDIELYFDARVHLTLLYGIFSKKLVLKMLRILKRAQFGVTLNELLSVGDFKQRGTISALLYCLRRIHLLEKSKNLDGFVLYSAKSECEKLALPAEPNEDDNVISAYVEHYTAAQADPIRRYRSYSHFLIEGKRFSKLFKEVLFNYKWIHGKLKALDLDAVLEDFDRFMGIVDFEESKEAMLIAQHAARLVSQVIKRSGEELRENHNSLSVELTGQLLSVANFALSYNSVDTPATNWITYLIEQCDTAAPWHNSLIPALPYTVTPVNPLLKTLHLTDNLLSVYQIEQSMFIKLKNDPFMYRIEFGEGRLCPQLRVSYGTLFLSPAQCFGAVVGTNCSETVKIYFMNEMGRVDGRVKLMGQINASQWVDPNKVYGVAEEQEEENLSNCMNHIGKTEILTVSMDNKFMGLLVESNCTPMNVVEKLQKLHGVKYGEILPGELAPGPNKQVLIFELETGKPLHVLNLSPSSTLLKLVEYEDSTAEKHRGFFCTNSGDQLLTFETESGEQLMAVALLAWPKQIIAQMNNQRLFVLCNEEAKVVILDLDEQAKVKSSYKIVFRYVSKASESDELGLPRVRALCNLECSTMHMKLWSNDP
ncbi:hypothetical protein Ciccas_012970 [Cichlidogyrus casuarinus]|uniref:Anaphase-promoting complex subunit 4 n=1 Tax=Cichlidogyrus casuarinus TaxID=1844966 RepID=A0ABD2PLU2_9PLAT